MAEAVLMPKQGQSVESCIITEWFKSKGDAVSEGDLLFAYETDKASFEEEAKQDGILLDVFYEAGDEVPVLTNVAVIGKKGESVDEFRPGGAEPAETEPAKEETKSEEPAESKEIEPDAEESIGGKIKISPRARRLAEDKNVAADQISGSGPGGRIIVRDVEEAIEKGVTAKPKEEAKEKKAAAPASVQAPAAKTETVSYQYSFDGDFVDEKASNMRKLIAKSMYNSLQNSAQLTHHLSADVRKLMQLRQKVKKLQADGYKPNITLNDMVCFAAIKAIKKNPEANVHFLGDSIRKFSKVHLGLAVDTDRGLMVPAVRNAGSMSLKDLSKELKTTADSCRAGKVDPDLLLSTSATFTVSNLGNYGVEMFTPILNVPQAVILGVNTIINRPAEIEKGVFGFVPHIGLSLTYDHRVLDGGPATRLLADIKYEIENFDIDIF